VVREGQNERGEEGEIHVNRCMYSYLALLLLDTDFLLHAQSIFFHAHVKEGEVEKIAVVRHEDGGLSRERTRTHARASDRDRERERQRKRETESQKEGGLPRHTTCE